MLERTLSVLQGSRLSRLFYMACMPVSDSLFWENWECCWVRGNSVTKNASDSELRRVLDPQICKDLCEKQHSLKTHLHLNDACCFIMVHMRWRSKHHHKCQNASTVLLRSAPFRVSGTIFFMIFFIQNITISS